MGYRDAIISTDTATTLGAFLRHHRARVDKSQTDIAAEVGVAQSVWARWEQGRVLPQLHRLPVIARALDVELVDLHSAMTDTAMELNDRKVKGLPAPQSRIAQVEQLAISQAEEIAELRKQIAALQKDAGQQRKRPARKKTG